MSNGIPSKVIAAVIGGAWGGAIAGLAEAALITATSPPEELWLFPFGIVAYGCFGAAVGSIVATAVALWRGRQPFDSGAAAAAVALFAFSVVVGRYHLMQRIFREDLPLGSPVGVAVHAALIAAALVVAIAVYLVLRRSAISKRPAVAALLLLLAGAAASAAAAIASSGSAAAAPARHASAGDRPSAILIIADTLRADSVAQRVASRPDGGLARLARDGVYFREGYAQSTWTRPSVATLLTSLYPSQHGTVQKMQPLPDDVTTIAEVFGEAGYWTAAFVSNINVAPIFNFQQGFGEYHYLSPSFYFGATDSATRLAIYKGLRLMRERLCRERIYFENYYQDAAVLIRAVTDWLGAAPPAPFFLLVHFMDPHDPYFEIPYNGHGVARVNNPNPAAQRAGEMRALYEENIDYFDDQLLAL
ncbi:MAG TPA: sulfatase-like hydrolase/transferase, partial [Terriglobales bacterium]|nr:sulfatase-like hydrolase/transferase [Terriglobales bacterium]